MSSTCLQILYFFLSNQHFTIPLHSDITRSVDGKIHALYLAMAVLLHRLAFGVYGLAYLALNWFQSYRFCTLSSSMEQYRKEYHALTPVAPFNALLSAPYFFLCVPFHKVFYLVKENRNTIFMLTTLYSEIWIIQRFRLVTIVD